MTPEEMFQVWSPPEGIWSPWVKPVAFAQLYQYGVYAGNNREMEDVDLSWVPEATRLPAAAVLVDLPAVESQRVGMALACRGYRPIPIFTAAMGTPMPANDLLPLISSLSRATELLKTLSFPGDAPPAFLIDARRNHNRVSPGQFDNNSVVFPQDFPSADFLIQQHIGEILIIEDPTRMPDVDLQHILLRYQQAGIKMWQKTIYTSQSLAPYIVPRPMWFQVAWYRALVRLGLRPNPAGGFGGLVPVPSSSRG